MWAKCEWKGSLFVLARLRMRCHADCVLNPVIFTLLFQNLGQFYRKTALCHSLAFVSTVFKRWQWDNIIIL